MGPRKDLRKSGMGTIYLGPLSGLQLLQLCLNRAIRKIGTKIFEFFFCCVDEGLVNFLHPFLISCLPLSRLRHVLYEDHESDPP